MTPTKDNALLADELERVAVNVAPLGSRSGHTRWDAAELMRKAAGALRLASTPAASGNTYTEICMNEKCPRGGKPVEVVRPLTGDGSTSVAGLDGGGVAT